MRFVPLNSQKWKMGNPVFEGDQECPMYRSWPWNGHRLFAYDLAKHIKPQLFVELGTYWGTSFFSFCQSVKDNSLDTRCVAIDTWEGDEHTGKYNDDAYQNVQRIANVYFPDLDISLIKGYFSDVCDTFDNESIDLLHIDGFHSYEAVSEDYHNWLPKLAENGVILFHDVAAGCGYGSEQFWHEISSQYPSYPFQHSWGLGVLFPKGDAHYQMMESNNFRDKLRIYTYHSELLLAQLQVQDLEAFNKNQDAVIKELQEKLALNEELHSQVIFELNTIKDSLFFKLLQKINRIVG